MATLLKQSTTVTIRMGPYLDKTDGVTEETALTPTFQVSKNHGAFAARNSATAPAHDANGWYSCELNTTDTGTLGPLLVKSHDAANALPVWREFIVVPANVYDSLVAGSDALDVSVIQVLGSAINALQAGRIDAYVGAHAAGQTAADSVLVTPAQKIKTDASNRVEASSVQGNVTGSVGSVTGAVGSVTGAVGSVTGNVGGSVASVTGAVGSVTGSVGSVAGDVAGKVLGGGAGVIAGVGARAVDGSGNAIAPASTALSTATWTAGRATAIDNLDAAVTTRAAAADYTALRAAKLDNLDATITSRHASGAQVASVAGAVGSVTGNVGGSVVGDVQGKVLGGGASALAGTGVRAVDGSGNAIAPASTALSTATWTAARAAKVDNLDATITSRHAAGAAVASVSGAVASVTADVGITQAGADKVWGSAARTLTTTIAYKKNTGAVLAFPMFSSVDGTPATGLTVTAERSIDGGAFAACSGAVAELAGGAYKITGLAADFNGDVVMFKFTSAGAKPTFVLVHTNV